MLEIYKAAKAEAGHNASRFLTMVNDNGGLETARILLHAATVSDGYTALWERGRLDPTVEALILEPRWHALFTRPKERSQDRGCGSTVTKGTFPARERQDAT